MAKAIQFVISGCGELFSFSAHFLHFVGTQNVHATKQFSAFFSAQKGERYFNYSVHRVVHSLVHSVNAITNLHTKELACAELRILDVAWARGGLERPRLLPHGAPERVLQGRSSPHAG